MYFSDSFLLDNWARILLIPCQKYYEAHTSEYLKTKNYTSFLNIYVYSDNPKKITFVYDSDQAYTISDFFFSDSFLWEGTLQPANLQTLRLRQHLFYMGERYLSDN